MHDRSKTCAKRNYCFRLLIYNANIQGINKITYEKRKKEKSCVGFLEMTLQNCGGYEQCPTNHLALDYCSILGGLKVYNIKHCKYEVIYENQTPRKKKTITINKALNMSNVRQKYYQEHADGDVMLFLRGSRNRFYCCTQGKLSSCLHKTRA